MGQLMVRTSYQKTKMNMHILLVLGLTLSAIEVYAKGAIAKTGKTGSSSSGSSGSTDYKRCDGQDSGCCEPHTPCDKDEGDCDSDWDCKGALYCGGDNCVKSWRHPTFDVLDDCCYGTYTCKGYDDCCGNAGYKCGSGEGDCDWDSDCKSGYYCGSNNCWGPLFDSTDDCCVKK